MAVAQAGHVIMADQPDAALRYSALGRGQEQPEKRARHGRGGGIYRELRRKHDYNLLVYKHTYYTNCASRPSYRPTGCAR
ncbi:hypothetical protein STHU_13900 [Allostella humosa]|nr:hypothetical protein STHU_13900 [Stella humosa]